MSRRTRRPTPPGEVLHEEFLSPMGLTQKQLADQMAMLLLQGRFADGDTVRVEASDGELVFVS